MSQNSISSSLNDYFLEQSAQIERVLETWLPKESDYPQVIHEAMRYSILGGGKRLRPLLVLAVSELLGGRREEAMLPACAVELIHGYSLVHDDLPCLDNDEFRRGKASCHKKFGEAIALLAGDALLTLAFYALSKMEDAAKSRRVLEELAHAAGTFGMIGGQVIDIVSDRREMDLPTLDYLSIHKTGQLIRASCVIGAVVAGAGSEEELRISKFGEYLGFAFQVIDDILDGDGYVGFMGVQEVKVKAAELIGKAKQELAGFSAADRLIQIADFVLERRK